MGQLQIRAEPGRSVRGSIRVPGDKSISHRAAILGALAEGHTRVSGFLEGADCLATVSALQSLGVEIIRDATRLEINGVGLHGLQAAGKVIDLGNSGTAMRLMTGLLCAQPFDTTLTGDESLVQRPMERVAEPLRKMGAAIETQAGCPPLIISGGRSLNAIDYAMPLASAQVKSAILLAGLYVDGVTSVTEPEATRDHTEKLLEAFGAEVNVVGRRVSVSGPAKLSATDIEIPGDFSSAAFFLLAGVLAEESRVTVKQVGVNPSRLGFLEILRQMGARIDIEPSRSASGEPVANVTATSSRLHGIEVPEKLVALSIDEFPLVFIAGALADGETRISGAEELRKKESDRISVMVTGLRHLGTDIQETEDGAVIRGGPIRGGHVSSHGDHRIAMAFAIAAGRAESPLIIKDTANVATSFPAFVEQGRSLGLAMEEFDA